MNLKSKMDTLVREPAAHNADFDRRFLEGRLPVFATKHWAYSRSDIDWKAEGVHSSALEFVAYALGLFHDGHRAIVGQPSMRWPSLSLAHGGLPYRLFWNKRDCRLGDCGHGKRLSRRRMSSKPAGIRGAQEISDDRGAGYRDVSDADKAAEVTWLRANVMEPDQSVWALRITARDRYSARCWGWGEPLAEPALQNLAGDFPQQPACIVTRSP